MAFRVPAACGVGAAREKSVVLLSVSAPAVVRFSELVVVAPAEVAAVSNDVDPVAPTMSTTPAAPAWLPVVAIGVLVESRKT